MSSSLFSNKNVILGPQTDSKAMFDNLMNTNPSFANFVHENANLTPEQIASKYGVDMSMLRRLIGRSG